MRLWKAGDLEYPDPKGGTRWHKPALGHAFKVPRTLRRGHFIDRNERYPLHEILAAKREGRRLKPQTRAAHW